MNRVTISKDLIAPSVAWSERDLGFTQMNLPRKLFTACTADDKQLSSPIPSMGTTH